MKTASAMGATAFMQAHKPLVASVFAQAADAGVKLVWIQGQSDTGCSISLLQGTHPDLYDAVQVLNVAIAYHPTLMPAFGEKAADVLVSVVPDILVVEGAIPTGDMKHACIIGETGGKQLIMEDTLRDLASKTTTAIVAVGACATGGGIPGADPNPTNAKGVRGVLGDGFTTKAGLPIINLPGCPAHPDWILLTLASALLGAVPALDSQGRPVAFASEKIHENCARRGYYDRGEFAESFHESDESNKKCLWKLGCKGPMTDADCSWRKWVNGTNVCMNGGAPCIGCFDLGFPDSASPFYEEMEKIPTLMGLNTGDAEKIALGVGAGGIAAHAIRRGVSKKPETKEE